MTATIIDGNAIAEKSLTAAAERVRQTKIKPCLAVIIVGDDPASRIYVRNKMRACEKVGINSQQYEMPADIDESTVLQKIRELNDDTAVHGILMQLPLPPQINGDKILEAISPDKDVDGFHPHNMGRLVANNAALQPCTPAGCMTLLHETKAPIESANAVVIGRSHIVGKPMSLMLTNAGATVTVCHSKTRNLQTVTQTADILIAAVGKPQMITADFVKPGAVVIDVGINRLANGKIVGDVDFEGVKSVATAITPVPGGVGRMTIAQLINNTLKAAGV